MEQLFLLLLFALFALGSHVLKLLRKRLESRDPGDRAPEPDEDPFPWLPEPAPPPRPTPVVLRAPEPLLRPAAAPPTTPLPAAPTLWRPRPRLTLAEARRGVVLLEVLGPCRGLEAAEVRGYGRAE
ncbi:MAG: hypothetical protein ACYDA8_15820 [Deferrisomatales bacterium]